MPAAPDPILADHIAWLGYVQPEGLVVSAAALKDAQAVIDRAQLGELQRNLTDHVADLRLADGDTAETAPGIADLPRFLAEFLGWPVDRLVGWDVTRPLPADLTVSLPEFGETLSPTYAFQDPKPKEGASPWLLLVQVHPPTTDLDQPTAAHDRGWHASPARKFERLLRETRVPIGLLTNGAAFKLVYAPAKENSGTLTFPVAAMTEVSGRLILGAFHLLLQSWTLCNAPGDARLPALLQRSRDYQASVSEELAEQVLHALHELLRGFEAADAQAKGTLLRDLAARQSQDIYGGLITVLLRLVFVLYAEDRGLLPMSGLYVRHYSVRGLFERLRADAERYPDTMDLRYGAWAQLLALFRLIHGGCEHAEMKMPPREGHLFDPQRFPFLEGRTEASAGLEALPLVSDGIVHRILEKLCLLGGERVSYRTLDVEEIGSVYQTIMGFGVEVVAGAAVALKGKRKNGGVPASPVINLEGLLALSAKDRPKWLKERADIELTGEADKRLKAAETLDDLLAALEKRIDRNATPAPVPKGGLVLQPTDERRRSGSHYTPRSFTEPIVRKTLEPILKRFGDEPTPAQILDLKIADIAVGSAAFLVETCRQLGDALVRAWRVHGGRPALPPDETEELLAMRLVAQRCLYGVDRNPMAVDLAKLSLWLATLAKDHPFTFLDHSIRCGDSLVGLTREQIACFTWQPPRKDQQMDLIRSLLDKRIEAAMSYRREILEAGDLLLPALKTAKLKLADEALAEIRFIGDAAVAAFFAADKDKAREAKRAQLAERVADYLESVDLKKRPTDEVRALRSGQFPVTPFHWEIEYPEVFARENPGFDAFVGNPPFVGVTALSDSSRTGYTDWLRLGNDNSGGKCDLVAFFFRGAFNRTRRSGTLGLIATNTIAQGDTRRSGLFAIVRDGGRIYSATRRVAWPGQAAVIVSVVHISKGALSGPTELDGRVAEAISCYLFPSTYNQEPVPLSSSTKRAFLGSKTQGIGFLFDDSNSECPPLSHMRELLSRNPKCQQRIKPYLGGEELNSLPEIGFSRFAIDMGDLDESEARKWPELMEVLERYVRPNRMTKSGSLKEFWWHYGHKADELYSALGGLSRVLAIARVSQTLAFTFLPAGIVYAEMLVVVPTEAFSAFCALQSRPHEVWARQFASSMKDDLRYTPTDCFETFPFPAEFETNAALETAGREYYEFRAALMQDLWLGLTEIYNLFHSPDDEALARLEALYRKRAATPDWRTAESVPAERSPLTLYSTPAAALAGVRRLRELHAAMDAAVLTVYGWTDLLPKCTCEFLLDYEGEDSESGEESSGRKKKKPWRYRWPEEVRYEVLARLLKLNAERAEEERRAGLIISSTTKSAAKAPTGAKRGRKPKVSAAEDAAPLSSLKQGDLFS
jgi:hypothetical protein